MILSQIRRVHRFKIKNLFSTKFKSSISNFDYTCGNQLHGYTVTEVENIPDIDAHVIQLIHNQTGAQHLHIARDDRNNTFSVGFCTTPTDSSGVSHILEHTTLCGSQKYPVRDPFFKMLTRSLSNFMNAFTANDWTMYLFSTQSHQDFQNLLSVYLNCVFFPLLRHLDFCQEGWRLEHSNINDQNSPIIFKGVVFNEMKGHFASSENIYTQALQNFLLPSHTYSHISGGKPIDIVDLTLEKLQNFHSTYYHPSNSFFLTYGNMPIETHLKAINDLALKNFNQSSSVAKVPYEKIWEVLRTEHIYCGLDPTIPDPSKQIIFSVSYLLAPITDTYESFVLKILSLLLMDGPASPFHKALIDRNIGSELSPCSGYNGDTLQAYFSIGLQGIKQSDVMIVERIIQSTFSQLANDGFSEDRIHSVLHQVELDLKHQKRNFGLMLATGVMSPWIHGSNPLKVLQINELVKRFEMDLLSNRCFLQQKIEEYFLVNNHVLNLTMTPSVDYEDSLQKEESRKLISKLSSMSKFELEEVFHLGITLQNDQKLISNADCLPTIRSTDVDKKSERIEVNDVNDICPIQLCVQPTNGLTYLNIAMNFNHISEDIKIYLPLFCYVLTRIGAGDFSYSEFTEQCDLYSGGLSAVPLVTCDHTLQHGFYQELLFTSHCLNKNMERMLLLWENILNKPNLKDEKHIRTLLKQLANNMAMGISEVGHKHAMYLSSKALLPSSYYRELLYGITQIKFLKSLLISDLSEVIHKFEVIAGELFNVNNMRFSVTSSSDFMDDSEKFVLKFIQFLTSSSDSFQLLTEDNSYTTSYGNNYHLDMAYPVNYVARSYKTVPYSHEDSPRLQVLAKLLSSKYLHKQIREIGGAYGSGANQSSSIFSLMSYRDPNSQLTIDTFNAISDWMKTGDYTEDDIDEAILSSFSEIDSPLSPSEKGSFAFLKRVSDRQRQDYRDALFHVSRKDLIRSSEKYLEGAGYNTAVIGAGNNLDGDWTALKF